VRTVTIDGNAVTIETEIIEFKNRDDELEITQIAIKSSSLLEPYDMGLQVIIVEDAITEYFITGQDKTALVERSPNKYNHTITLIEPYKEFERITMSSLQYTQPLNTTKYTLLDVVDRALKLMLLETTSDLGGERIYDIDGIGTRDANDNYIIGNLSGLASDLHDIKAPEMKFNTPYLSEIFNEVFLLLDGRPYLKDFATVGIKYYNETNDEITLDDVDEITGEQNIEKNAQKFDIYMENAISETNANKQAVIYPSENSWASVRSSDTELTTNNFLMQVNDNIERILKFEIRVKLNITYFETNGGSTNTLSDDPLEITVDMTDWLFTKRAWEGLDFNFDTIDNTGSQDTLWKSQYKNNALYFEDNKIKGWHEDLDIWTLFGSTNQWNVFLGTAAFEGGYLVAPTPGYWIEGVGIGVQRTKFATSSGVEEFLFRLTYVPSQTVRYQIEKDKPSGHGTLFANQQSRIVDSELLGANMLNRLNREGEKTLQFTKTVTDFTDAFQLGDYYEEYRAVKVNNIRKTEYTLSVATLSKNYSKKSERIDLANQPRQTNISKENTIRNDIFNEYIEVSTVQGSKTGSITLVGGSSFIDTFLFPTRFYQPIEFALFEGDIIASLTSQGIGKTLSFKFQFENNVTAGISSTLIDSIYANQFVVYAPDGLLDTANISLYSDLTPDPNTFDQSVVVANLLPKYDAGESTLGFEMFDLPELNILKDSGEVYALSYQMKLYTDDPDIYIGNRLATNNGLVIKATEQLYLYSWAQKLVFGEKVGTHTDKQLIKHGAPGAGEVRISASLLAIIPNIEFTTNFNNLNWAIANDDGDVYVIVNKFSTPKIYFNPKNKRSD